MDWRAAFLAKPSISIRKGIAFGYDEPRESSSTLVLTAPSGKFVDIRFPLKMAGQHPSLKGYSSYWAFSGTSQTTFYDETEDISPGLPYTAHTTFIHDIDTKGPGIVDEGDCFLLPNGDVIEVGIWHDTKQLYKEYWTEPESSVGQTLLKTPVVVMETVDAVNGRGIVIRIGNHVQGIFEYKDNVLGEKILVSRAIKQPYEDGTLERGSRRLIQDAWVVDDRSNTFNNDNETIPCNMVTHEQIALGSEIVCGGNTWRVTELEC